MTQPFTLKLGSLDLSNYIRLAQGEGFDPMDGDGYREPAFSDSPLAEGQLLGNIDTQNRQMAWPLHLKDDTLSKNSVPNGTFEDGTTTGWAAGAAGTTLNTFAVISTWSSSGTQSLRASFTQPDATSRSPNIATPVAGIPCYPGSTMAFAATINLDDAPTAGTLRVRMFWYKADGTASATVSSTGTAFVNPAVGIYSLASNFTVPSDAFSCRIVVEISAWVGSLDTCSFYMDDVSIYMTSAGKDAVHALVRAINNEIASNPNLTVEWKDIGASNSTFYNVAFARFDPEFNYRRSALNWESGTLHIWCAPPYGHTGTTRIVATGVTPSGIAPVAVAAVPSIAGDVPALGVYEIGAGILSGLKPQSPQAVRAIAALPHPSYSPWWPAASIVRTSLVSTMVGASWAYASQALMLVNGVSLLPGLARPMGQIVLPASPMYSGRNRIFGFVGGLVASVAGMATGNPTYVAYALDKSGQLIGPTAVFSVSRLQDPSIGAGAVGFNNMMVDLGVYAVPTYAATPALTIYVGIAGSMGASVAACSMLNGVVVVPDDSLTYTDLAPLAQYTSEISGGHVIAEPSSCFDGTGQDDSSYANFYNSVGGVQGHENFSVDSVRRGAVPRIPVGATGVLAVISHNPPLPASGAQSYYNLPSPYVIRARERFQFAR